MWVLCCVSLGKDESKLEKVHSIMAKLAYRYQVTTWDAKGIPFKKHLILYVPKVHPETGKPFCEREDEGHVLKVCKGKV